MDRGARYRGRCPSADEAVSRKSGVCVRSNRRSLRSGLRSNKKGTDLLSDFLDAVYLPWSRVNKKSWHDAVYTVPMSKAYFEGKALRDISVQLVAGSKLIA
jgi:hypothetical protein